MAPATRRRARNGGRQAAAEDGDDDAASKRRRQATKTKTPTPTAPVSPRLSAAEAADARELEELGGIDPATSFLYTPHTLTGLVIGKRDKRERGFSFFLSFFLAAVSAPP